MRGRKYVVTIHGVWETKPSESLGALARRIGTEYGQQVKMVDGIEYPAFVPSDPNQPTLYEVNWADVERPKRTWSDSVVRFVKLMVSMLSFADLWHGDSSTLNRLAPYRWLIEGVVGWQVLFAIYVMYLASFTASANPLPTNANKTLASATESKELNGAAVKTNDVAPESIDAVPESIGGAAKSESSDVQQRPSTAGRCWILIVGTAGVGCMTYIVRNWSLALLIGGIVWTIAFLFVGLYAAIYWHDDLEQIVEYTTWTHSVVHGVTVFSMAIVLLAVLFVQHRELNLTQRFTRLAFAFVPVIAISVVSACLWALALPWAKYGGGFDSWQQTYKIALGINLRDIEWAMATELGLIAGATIAGVGVYIVRRWTPLGGASRAGAGAKTAVAVVLYLIPVVLLIVPFVALYDSKGWSWLWWTGTTTTRLSVMEIYAISALRIVPYLPFLITPLSIIYDIVGDITFYVLPEEELDKNNPDKLKHPLRIRGIVKNRFQTIVSHLLSSESTSLVLIVSHSQGTVIATDVLYGMDDPRVRLVTMGSPVGVLYQRFLRWPGTDAVPWKWTNYYTWGDFIGGRIERPNQVEEKEIEEGGHVGYFSAPEVVNMLYAELDHDDSLRSATN